MARGSRSCGKVILGAALVLFGLPGAASSAVTVGSNLSQTPDTGICFFFDAPGSCTYAIVSLPAGTAAAGGSTIPSDGVVVRWRVKGAAGTTPGTSARFRAIRGNTAAGASAEIALPATAGIHEFATRVRVQAGDRIGVDIQTPESGFAQIAVSATTAMTDTWFPALGDAETRPPDVQQQSPLLLNADLEPDADGDGYGDETQDGCPTDAGVQGQCPTPPPGEPALCKGKPATVSGTEADDLLRGTGGDDVIAAVGGADVVKAGGGNDLVCGGDGDDELEGQGGKDKLNGEDGRDKLKGGGGKGDVCNGGEDKDKAAASCEKQRDIR